MGCVGRQSILPSGLGGAREKIHSSIKELFPPSRGACVRRPAVPTLYLETRPPNEKIRRVVAGRGGPFLSKGAIQPWAGGCGRRAQQSPQRRDSPSEWGGPHLAGRGKGTLKSAGRGKKRCKLTDSRTKSFLMCLWLVGMFSK